MMNKKMENCCVTLDVSTRKKIEDFAESHSLSKSAVIRLAINEFFLTKILGE